jgi:hypothetical protein
LLLDGLLLASTEADVSKILSEISGVSFDEEDSYEICKASPLEEFVVEVTSDCWRLERLPPLELVREI